MESFRQGHWGQASWVLSQEPGSKQPAHHGNLGNSGRASVSIPCQPDRDRRAWQEGISGHRARCSFTEEALLQVSSSTVAEEAKSGAALVTALPTAYGGHDSGGIPFI